MSPQRVVRNHLDKAKVVARKPPKQGTPTWGTRNGIIYPTACDGPCNEATWNFGMAYAAVADRFWADNVIRRLKDIRYVPLKPLLCLLPFIDINIASMAALSTYA